MATLKGRRFFFGTRADLVAGPRTVEQAEAVEYVLHKMRDDDAFTVTTALSTRVGLYWLGPEALKGFRAGQRLVTIGARSPREYDLAER